MFKNKAKFKIVILIAILIVLLLISLSNGKFNLNINDVLNGDSLARSVLFKLRIPRTLMVIISGFSISVVGTIYQRLFKNPLASPDIIGVASGASVGSCISIVFFGAGIFLSNLFAFLGGIIAVSMTIFLGELSHKRDISIFVVCGIAINAIAQALISLIKYTADPLNQLASIEFWLMGSFASVTYEKLCFSILFISISMIALFMLDRQTVLLSLDNDEACMLGVPVKLYRRLILIFATIAVASVVSVTGLISFIGLIAPHIACQILDVNNKHTLLLSGLVGANILTMSDIAARSITGGEIPISIVTSFIGVPFLLYLIYKGGKIGRNDCKGF